MTLQVKQVQVLVAARSPLSSETLACTLAQDSDLHAEHARIQSVVEVARATQPHVVILSHKGSSNQNGSFNTLREVLAASPNARVVLLVDDENSALAVDALRFGAKGVFCVEHPLEMLIRCIKQVHAGQVWISAVQLEFLLAVLAGALVTPVVDAQGAELLSRREQDVIRWIGEGLSNREIADVLRISGSTVKNYVYRIFNKLGVSNRVEAAMYAAAHRASSPAKLPQSVPLHRFLKQPAVRAPAEPPLA